MQGTWPLCFVRFGTIVRKYKTIILTYFVFLKQNYIGTYVNKTDVICNATANKRIGQAFGNGRVRVQSFSAFVNTKKINIETSFPYCAPCNFY